jgi:tripartite-type tricarboxylate transporter receptor subunit TctC
MELNRRETLLMAAMVAAGACGPARAQSYPDRTVKLVSPYAPGGATDIIARLVGKTLSEKLGQAFVIENRAGGGTNIGTEAVSRSAPDGYTLLLASSSNAVNATLYPKLRFNFLQDFVLIGNIGAVSNMLVVHPSLPVRTAAEFIAYAKANPGKINMGIPGNGSPQHLSAALFKNMTGIDLTFVQYQGGGPVLNDLLGGHVQSAFASSVAGMEYVKSGSLLGLGVTGAERVEALANMPTLGETVPGYEASNFYGLAAPKGTPPAIIETLNRELKAALADKSLLSRFDAIGLRPKAMSAADFTTFVTRETEKWRQIITTAGIRME